MTKKRKTPELPEGNNTPLEQGTETTPAETPAAPPEKDTPPGEAPLPEENPQSGEVTPSVEGILSVEGTPSEEATLPEETAQFGETASPEEFTGDGVEILSAEKLTSEEPPADLEGDVPAEEPPEQDSTPSPAEAETDVPAFTGEEADTSAPLPPEEPKPPEPPEPKRPAAPEQKTFYQLDFHELDRDLTPEQRQEWNSIYASYRGRSALTGEIIGIDRHAISTRDKSTGAVKRQEMYCAIVVPFRVRILIPETEMWPRGEERPPFVLRNMVGARIDFIILHVDREGGFAIASRKQALSSRRYYFSTQPSMNKVGSRVKCCVLAVGPRRCLVSCYGHDVNLTQREMRYTAIPDLRDEYRPGQELDCIVKGYDREAGKLLLSVKETQPNPFDGAEQRHPLGSRRQAAIAGKYAGGVFCNLPDGAVCMCSYSYQYEDSAFAIGDKVILAIQHYDNAKKQIYGKIVAKW